jgi:biotin carboxyl carrier protein
MESDFEKLNVDETEYITEVPGNSVGTYRGLPDPSEVRAFIPGTIVEVRVSAGDMVRPGDVLVLLDAMKMYNEICSTISGRVREVSVSTGDTVQKDQLLVSLRRG